MGILCLGVAAFGLTPITSAGITITRQTMYAMRYAGAAVVVSVGLCLVLIPTVGLVGAAIATALGYATVAVLSLRRSQMLSRAEFQLGKVGRVFLLGGALMPVGHSTLPRRQRRSLRRWQRSQCSLRDYGSWVSSAGSRAASCAPP